MEPSPPERSATRDLSSFTGAGYDKGRSIAWQAVWLVTDSLVFKRWWFPARARNVVLRMFGASIGDGVLIRHGVRIHWPWKLTIGRNSWIGVDAWILNLERVAIGENTCISQGVMLCTGSHDASSPSFDFDNGPIDVGDCVWLGARSTVLRGVTIGNDVLIGACCLVVTDVPQGAQLLAPLPRTVK